MIYQGLQAAKSRFKSGNLEVEGIIAEFRKTIEACADLRVQYAELVHSENLRPVLKIEGSEDFALIVAVIYADVRLIDNIEFGGSN